MSIAAAAISAGASLVGGMMSSDAAQSAADAQVKAAQDAAKVQQAQNTQTRNDLAPYRNLGSGLINPLLTAMGYSQSSPAQPALTYDQLYQQLLPQFTKQGASRSNGNSSLYNGPDQRYAGSTGHWETQGTGGDNGSNVVWVPDASGTGGGSTIDTAGLNAAVQAALTGQQSASLGSLTPDTSNILQQKFGFNQNGGAVTPGVVDQFHFNPGDLTQTPGYQFNYSQGMRAVDNSAAAQGLGLSGAQMKGAMRFASGLADNTYQNQFGNALNTYNTNLGSALTGYNTNYNTASQNVNRLLGLVGNGQNAANQTGAFGIQTAGNVGNMINSAGQSAASGTVGSANALSGALGGVGNNALLYSMLNKNNGGGVSTLYGTNGINGVGSGLSGSYFPVNAQTNLNYQ